MENSVEKLGNSHLELGAALELFVARRHGAGQFGARPRLARVALDVLAQVVLARKHFVAVLLRKKIKQTTR